MTDFVVTPPAVNGIPVHSGHGQLPVRRVYCVDRNYATHTRKMGSDPDRGPPFSFCEPADAMHYVTDGKTGQFIYPTETRDCRYEIELVVAIGTSGCDIAVKTTAHHVYGYAIGLGTTHHDLWSATKKGGHPWETGKAFNGSTPIGPIMPAKDVTHPDKGVMMLSVNGREHQRGDLPDLIRSIPETIAHPLCLFGLRPGDLIYTGTPEGVGPAVVGDLMVGKIDGMGELHVEMIQQTR